MPVRPGDTSSAKNQSPGEAQRILIGFVKFQVIILSVPDCGWNYLESQGCSQSTVESHLAANEMPITKQRG
jgi:hypothetical protein